LFSYLNYRFIRLPTPIGVVLIALQHFGFRIGPMAASPRLMALPIGQNCCRSSTPKPSDWAAVIKSQALCQLIAKKVCQTITKVSNSDTKISRA
jgi:hypothetical protein